MYCTLRSISVNASKMANAVGKENENYDINNSLWKNRNNSNIEGT